MNKNADQSSPMGPQLRAEVERQLLKDIQHYTHEDSGNLTIDWSDICPEGHGTCYFDGRLENWSDVGLVNAQREKVAEGWIDFVHGGDDNPLFVFWLFLYFGAHGREVVGAHGGIPRHIWESLPDSSKDLCLTTGAYDSAWKNDPLVQQWHDQRSR